MRSVWSKTRFGSGVSPRTIAPEAPGSIKKRWARLGRRADQSGFPRSVGDQGVKHSFGEAWPLG